MSNATTQPSAPYPAPPQPSQTTGGKSFIATWILALLLGGLGKVGTGLLKLVTLGGLGVWALIDLIITLAGAQRDKLGRPLIGADNRTNRKIAWVVSAAVIVLGIVLSSVSHPSTSNASAGTAPITTTSEKTDAGSPAPSAKSTPSYDCSTFTDATALADCEKGDFVSATEAQLKASPLPTPAAPKPAAPAAPAAPQESLAQANARGKAADYLGFTSFSHTGLIKQLEFDGFSAADATYSTDAQHADWNAEAAKKAKDYLGFTSFSHSGLVSQLEFDGFTPAQAEYGVRQAGL